MNLANRLTILRVLLVPIFMWVFLWDFSHHYIAAFSVFVIAALTDLFDGKVARSRSEVTNFGKFVDPVADKILTTAAFIGLLTTEQLNPWALLIILVREFAVASVRMLASGGGKVIAANTWGKFKTVAQYVAIICSIAALEFENWQTGWLSSAALPDTVFTTPLLISQVLLWISAALTLVSGIEYVWSNREYIKE